MRQIFLALVLILVPVGLFTGIEVSMGQHPQISALGDMSVFSTIVTDVQNDDALGDAAKAAARITDFEMTWDEAESGLRPLDPALWGNVDSAADDAITALRRKSPDMAQVTQTLVQLQAVLADPRAAGEAGGLQSVAGIAVTDANGHPLPCESMLATLRDGIAKAGAVTAAATLADLQAKATERCNADDDAHADAFSAQAIALLPQS